jgi:hypothetical protein
VPLWLALAAPVYAQAVETATRTRLDLLLTTATGTPEGKGLVSVALREARIATAQAALAVQATTDLTAMQQHARGVIHAVDPTIVPTGPGLGYGVTRAAAAIAQEVQRMAAADLAPDVALHTKRALTAVGHVRRRADAVLAAAQGILKAGTAAEAAPLAATLLELSMQLTGGSAARDSRLTGPPAEGGLAAVEMSLAVLMVGREGRVPASLQERAR